MMNIDYNGRRNSVTAPGSFSSGKEFTMNKSIIRRLDDFGRITLPYDMRRAMRLEESDPVEVVYENQKITISPYVSLSEIEYFTLPCLKALAHSGDNNYVFTTRNEVSLSFIKGAERGIPLTEILTCALRLRKDRVFDDFSIQLTEHSRYAVTALFPILASGDLHGGIVIVTDEHKTPTENQLVKAKFLQDIVAQAIERL